MVATASIRKVDSDFLGEAGSDVGFVIMAGGLGTRLGDLTRDVPKPMIPMIGKPMLQHVLAHLRANGAKHVALSLHHLSHKIVEHFEHWKSDEPKLHFSISSKNLGTAGGVRLASKLVKGRTVVVVSGDVLTNMNLRQILEFHWKKRSHFTMALGKASEDCSCYGVAECDSDSRIQHYIEKPRSCGKSDCLVNCGIYAIDRSILAKIPEGIPYDFSLDLIPNLMAGGIAIFGWRMQGYWFDIGTPEHLREAEAFLSEQTCQTEPRLEGIDQYLVEGLHLHPSNV